MTAVEQLIKEKLQAALDAEKRRVAVNLVVPKKVTEAFTPQQGMNLPMAPKNDGNAKADMNQRRQKKSLQVKKFQGQLQTQMAGSALGGTTDPTKMQKKKDKAVVLRHKVALGQAELKSMR